MKNFKKNNKKSKKKKLKRKENFTATLDVINISETGLKRKRRSR
jgi:hypothetical protein